jgi:hypothetical protein
MPLEREQPAAHRIPVYIQWGCEQGAEADVMRRTGRDGVLELQGGAATAAQQLSFLL